MKNIKIRMYAIENNIRHYRIAEKLHLSEATFSRLLRKELPEEKVNEIISVIDELAEKKE